MRKHVQLIAVFAIGATIPLSASAQQFSPLTITPVLNLTLAVDTSHEMALSTSGSGYFPGLVGNRLADLRNGFVGASATDPAAAIYPFRSQFLWSGFAYSGARFAKIKDGSGSGPFNTFNTIRVPPISQSPLSIQSSYLSVRSMLNGTRPDFCNATKGSPACTENTLPGGAALSCITTDCLGDQAIVVAVMNGGLTGFALPTGLAAMDINTEIACDDAAYPTSPALAPATTGPLNCDSVVTPGRALRPICELAHELSYFSWPRFDPPGIPAYEVDDQFCTPMEIAFANVQAKLNDCLVASPTVPDLTPVPSPGTGPGGYSCQAGNISANICTGASPFNTSCVCDNSNPACGGGIVLDDCNVPMVLRARQQLAMCFSHNPDPSPAVSPIFNGLRAQPDNTLAGGAGCRGNTLMYLTDGLGGDSSGVSGNASANFGAFRTFDPPTAMVSVPQNYVVQAGNRPQADIMQDVIQDATLNGTPTAAILGIGVGQVRSTLGRVVQRNLRGTYTAANITFDRFETRAAFLLYEVPGAPDLANDVYSAYLGRPTRIAMHNVQANGVIDAIPLWESDYASRAGISAIGGPTEVYMTFLGTGPTPEPLLGPTGTWAGGLAKDVFRNTGGTDRLDRNGDGTINAADVTPEPVRWGYMLGGENAAPLIIETPREVPIGGSSGGGFARFQTIRAVADRPSTVVAYTNGWVVGLSGGNATGGFNFNNQRIEKTYRDDPSAGPRYDSAGAAGRELFRIRPSFIYAAGNPSAQLIQFNESIQQPLMNGHMIAREVLLGNNPERFATVLIFTQGSAGRGIAAVDLSDPERGGLSILTDTNSAFAFDPSTDGPRPMWEVLLPDPLDRATAKPVIYSFPQPKIPAGAIDTNRVTMLVTVGGAGGSSNIYAYRVRDGVLTTMTALPSAGGQSYRTAPSCVDTDGRGAAYCYVVRSDGLLVRVPIDRLNGVFGAAIPLSSAMVGGGRQFWTEPVVTFSADNSIAIFAASGDINQLASPVSTNNAMYKLVDSTFSRGTGGIDILNVCSASGTGSTNGVIPFGSPQEMVVSPPTVVRGVLGYTTYQPGADGCTPGTARLYTMNYETCFDATRSSTNRRPVGRGIGVGVPTSPSIMRRLESVVTHTSKEPTAGQARASQINSKAGALLPLQKSYNAPQRTVQ